MEVKNNANKFLGDMRKGNKIMLTFGSFFL